MVALALRPKRNNQKAAEQGRLGRLCVYFPPFNFDFDANDAQTRPALDGQTAAGRRGEGEGEGKSEGDSERTAFESAAGRRAYVRV
jgi:hypothetical protein